MRPSGPAAVTARNRCERMALIVARRRRYREVTTAHAAVRRQGWACNRTISIKPTWNTAQFLCPGLPAEVCNRCTDDATSQPDRFSMPCTSGATRARPQGIRQRRHLCPRCRARVCNGSRLELLLTCAFTGRFVNLPEECRKTGAIGTRPNYQAPLTSRFHRANRATKRRPEESLFRP